MMDFLKKINRKLLVTPKIVYFLVNLQYYTLHQFRGAFVMKKFGASDGDLAKYMGPMLGAIFFTNIFIGAMNDKFGRSHFFIMGALLLTCALLQLFFVDSYTGLFEGMFWINLLLYMSFNNGIPPLLDKAMLDFLNGIPEAGARAYGRQKLWGTAGYGLSSIVIERCIKDGDAFHFDNLKYYSLITTALSTTAVFLFLKSPAAETRTVRRDIISSCFELMKSGSYLFFIFMILLNGITRQALSIYHTVYLTEVLQVKGYELPESWPFLFRYVIDFFNKSPIGTITICGTLFEVIMLYHFPKISQKIGLMWPFFIAQLLQIFRVSCYYMLDYNNPNVFAYCCLIELTRGMYFGLLHPSAVQLAMNLCPPHLKSTSQMIYQGTFTALGSVAASLVCSGLFSKDKMKSKDMPIEERVANYQLFFVVNMCFATVTTGLFIYKYFILDKIRMRNSDIEKKAIIESQGEDVSKDLPRDEGVKKMPQGEEVTSK